MTDIEHALTELIRGVVREEIRLALREVEVRKPSRTSEETIEFVTVKRAAKIASVHPATVRSWLSDGKLKPYRAGRVFRVKIADLEAFLARDHDKSSPIDIEKRATEILAGVGRRKKPKPAQVASGQ